MVPHPSLAPPLLTFPTAAHLRLATWPGAIMLLIALAPRPGRLTAQPAGACAPIPAGFHVEQRAADGSRCADVLRRPDAEGSRRLRVYERGVLAFAVDRAPKCAGCGGVRGDPFAGLEWRAGALTVRHEGGSREQWQEQWTFASRGGRWVLAGWERAVTDQRTAATWMESVNTLTGRATFAYEPPSDGCANALASDCYAPRPISRRCRHPEPPPAPAAAPAIAARPWACGARAP